MCYQDRRADDTGTVSVIREIAVRIDQELRESLVCCIAVNEFIGVDSTEDMPWNKISRVRY